MIIQTKNNKELSLQRLDETYFDRLVYYLQNLSEDTKKRFGPHPFDKASIVDLYKNPGAYTGYTATNMETEEIVAYSVIKIGYLEHDSNRLRSYGLTLSHETDCTFAPSVADAWQSTGIGNSLLHFMIDDLKNTGIKRIILWGGVQSDNTKAVNFYRKNGFSILGRFEYNGWNDDMLLEIN